MFVFLSFALKKTGAYQEPMMLEPVTRPNVFVIILSHPVT